MDSKNKSAIVIQNFYRTFIKCERENINGKYMLIDPIYKTHYDEKYRIKILHYYKKNDKRKIISFNFNINSLVEWINTVNKFTNPIINSLFTCHQVNKIIAEAKKYNLLINSNAIPRWKVVENKIKKELPELIKFIANKDSEKAINFILENQKNLELLGTIFKSSDYSNTNFFYKLKNKDSSINKSIKIQYFTPLLLSVYKDMYDVVEMLLMFGVNSSSTINGLSPLHLSIILNNSSISKFLLFNGVNDNVKFKKDSLSLDTFELIENFSDLTITDVFQ